MSKEKSDSQTEYPLRLAFTGADGHPRIVSLWYWADAGKFYCVTHNKSYLISRLNSSVKVAFEISNNHPPYKGTRGTASVKTYPLQDSPLLEQLLSHYTGSLKGSLAEFLMGRKESEMIVELTPIRQSSWDFTARMSGPAA